MWSHDLKLSRARKHLKELEAEVDRWVNVDGCAIRMDPDPEPPSYIIRAKLLRDPGDDDTIPVLIGDVLQNARAALEHIAYALGEAGGMTAEQAERSGYPIIGDVDKDGFSGRGADMFESAAADKLAAVPPKARALIEENQPFYNAPAWRYDALWTLNELARIDRHRLLHVIAVRSGNLRTDPATTRNTKIRGEIDVFKGSTIYPAIEDSADLARLTAIPANPQQKMDVHFRDALTLVLDAEGSYIDDLPLIDTFSVNEVLSSCVLGVSIMLTRLTSFLRQN